MNRSARILVIVLTPSLLAGQVVPSFSAGYLRPCCGGSDCPVCLARIRTATGDTARPPASRCESRPGCSTCRAATPETAVGRTRVATLQPAQLHPLCKCREGRSEQAPPVTVRMIPRSEQAVSTGVASDPTSPMPATPRRSIVRDHAAAMSAGRPAWIRNCSLLT